MTPSKDFWSQDRTTIHQKSGWYGKLPPLQKLCYTLLLLFIIFWCFYLGMAYAMAIAPERDVVIKDGSEWKQGDEDTPPPEVVRLEGIDVILLVGADKREGESKYRTDTILLAFFNYGTSELNLLSIPRDTYVQLPGKSTKTKINEAYFYGGMALLEATIEYTFGIEVDHYAEIDFAGFLQLINALGGVEIDVPVRMYKPTEEINIQKGKQVLNGYDALGFVRYRDLPMGDIDRIANQQAFIRALAAKIMQGSTIWKAPQLVGIALEHTNTTYALAEALALGNAVMKTDLNNIPMYSLPGYSWWITKGADDINFWILKKADTIAIITEITDGEVGDFHIIDHGGQGSAEKPKKVVKEDLPEDGEEADPGDGGETPATEGEGEYPANQSEGEFPAQDGVIIPATPPEETPIIPIAPEPGPNDTGGEG